MAWFNVGESAIGVVGSLMGGHAQNKADKRAMGIEQAQLDFERERYQDWKDVYGNLQEGIGAYYNNLTGATISAKEVEAYQQAGQASANKIKATLAQRGISGSGLEAELLSNNIINTEIKKAEAISTADQRAVERKQNFLSIGLGEGNSIANSMADTSANIANTSIASGKQQATSIGNVTGFLYTGLNAIGRR